MTRCDDPILSLEHVWKAFDRGSQRVPVLEDVSFSLKSGTINAVVAGRAQGKTTLLRVASGTLPPDRGVVIVEGVNVAGVTDSQLRPILARTIGLAKRSGPRARLTVKEYLNMALGATKEYTARDTSRRTDTALVQYEIADCRDRYWGDLTDWQRVLVELAQATITTPKIVLVDDIVDGLSLGKKQAAMDLIEGIVNELRCAVLLAVSDHAAALRSDQVWQLKEAKLKLMHKDPGRRGVIDLNGKRTHHNSHD